MKPLANYDAVEDAVIGYDPSGGAALYVNTYDRNLYKMVYKTDKTDWKFMTSDIWGVVYDSQSECPVTVLTPKVAQRKDSEPGVYLLEDGVVTTKTCLLNIDLVKSTAIDRDYLAGGILRGEQLTKYCKDNGGRKEMNYPQKEWILMGKNKYVKVYHCPIRPSEKTGYLSNSVIIISDNDCITRDYQTSRGYVYTYRDVLVLRKMKNRRSDRKKTITGDYEIFFMPSLARIMHEWRKGRAGWGLMAGVGLECPERFVTKRSASHESTIFRKIGYSSPNPPKR